MRKGGYIALAVLLVMLAGVSAWRGLREREPVYQGKALRAWLSEDFNAWARQDRRAQDIAEGGIRQIGTNAIPILLKMMRKKDSPFVSGLIPLWERYITGSAYLPAWVRSRSWFPTRASVLNMQALKGFEVLRANAQTAVPKLITIYELYISPENQFCVRQALLAIGPQAARAALPSFLRAAGSSDARVREFAIVALSRVHAEPSLVVPALVKSMSDTSAHNRSIAAMGLKEIGCSGGARPAVPKLVQLLTDQDAQVRRAATDALKSIDYDAAVKAGVQ